MNEFLFEFEKALTSVANNKANFDVDVDIDKEVDKATTILQTVDLTGNSAILFADVEAVGENTEVEVDTSILTIADELSSISIFAESASDSDDLIVGDVVFVIDTSSSTGSPAQDIIDSVGDQNSDGISDSILDAEILAFTELNDTLDPDIKVSIVPFSSSASPVVFPNGLTFTSPDSDDDTSGVSDIVEALQSLSFGGLTNYVAALEATSNAVVAAGTLPNDGTIVFVSDGEPMPAPQNFTNEVNELRDVLGQKLLAFGVGSGSLLPDLQMIDPGAQQFIEVQDLIDLFASAQA
ncbi:MAG: vWA domain-containing protein [Cyanobacteria bacterium P01_F01_bin.33]